MRSTSPAPSTRGTSSPPGRPRIAYTSLNLTSISLHFRRPRMSLASRPPNPLHRHPLAVPKARHLSFDHRCSTSSSCQHLKHRKQTLGRCRFPHTRSTVHMGTPTRARRTSLLSCPCVRMTTYRCLDRPCGRKAALATVGHMCGCGSHVRGRIGGLRWDLNLLRGWKCL